jgi:haloalkane dehalogenase
VSPAFAEAFVATLHNCHLINLGPGVDFLQEDHADAIGETLRSWIEEINERRSAGAGSGQG